MVTTEILDVLKEFGVRQCHRKITDYPRRDDTDLVKTIDWVVKTEHFPPAMNCGPRVFKDVKLVSWQTVNDLKATKDRALHLPRMTHYFIEHEFQPFLERYMMTLRSVPYGFCSADTWQSCSFHSPEFLHRKLMNMKDFYDHQHEIIMNEKVQHLRELWISSTCQEKEELKSDIQKIAAMMTKKERIRLEGELMND